MGVLERLIKPIALRFIGGETLDEAIEVAKQLNSSGFDVILNYLGEESWEEREVEEARAEYIKLLERMEKEGVRGSIAVKPTQLGILCGTEYENISSIVSEAKRLGRFVWVDMEGCEHTHATIELYLKLLKDYKDVGLALQAYLKRTPMDLRKVLKAGGIVRLCKGAYAGEPERISYKGRGLIRSKYMELMDVLFNSENYFALATHDDVLIRKALSYKRDPKTFEFQILKGVRIKLGKELVERGYKVSVYVPYGTRWLPYSMRRIRERKSNILLLTRALISR